MSEKYSGRALSSISRDTYSTERSEKEPSWFGDFVANLEKNSVKSKHDLNMIDQINNILTNKSKYSNVEEAVLDMQKRTGLLDYMQRKEAQVLEEPAIFKKIPAMKMFIDNYVGDRPGTAVESVVHDMLRIKSIKDLLDSDDVSNDVRHYINNKIKEKESLRPSKDAESFQLGKLDLDVNDGISNDNDPFKGCEPNGDSR